MHHRAPSPEVQRRDSAYRLRPAGRARERHSRDTERSPNVETGAVSVGRLQGLMEAKRDAEFEAEISLLEDHNADIPDPILSAQITQLFTWRNQAIELIDPCSGLLRFFADFDQVPFSVADFKELHVAPILDRSSENAATGKMFVGLL